MLGAVLFWGAVVVGAVGVLMVEGATHRQPVRRCGFLLLLASLGTFLFLALCGWD